MDVPQVAGRRRRTAAFALLVLFVVLSGVGLAWLQPMPAFGQETAEAQAAAQGVYFAAPQPTEADYSQIAGINSRVLVWLVAQLHLWFAAFILAVPIFVLIIEGVGMATRDERYDKMAYEFIKISITAYSLTAICE